MTGPPSARTPELVDAILTIVATGKSLTSAATTNGITRRTFTKWCGLDPDLQDAYEIAKGRGLSALEDRLLVTTDATEARVIGHRVGRLDPDEWGEQTTLVHDGKLSIAEAFKAAKE